jgi:hypothetical protein
MKEGSDRWRRHDPERPDDEVDARHPRRQAVAERVINMLPPLTLLLNRCGPRRHTHFRRRQTLGEIKEQPLVC